MTTSPDSVTYPASINEIVGPTEAAPWEATLRPHNPWKGLFGFDTISDVFEFYDGSGWKHPIWSGGDATLDDLTLTGTLDVDGLTTATGGITAPSSAVIQATGTAGTVWQSNGTLRAKFIEGASTSGSTISTNWDGATSSTGFANFRQQLSVSGTPLGTVGNIAANYSSIFDAMVGGSLANLACGIRTDYRLTTGGNGSRIGHLTNVIIQNTGAETPGGATIQHVASCGWIQSAVNIGGTGFSPVTNSMGVLFGDNPKAALLTGATFWRGIVGSEFNIEIRTGASAYYKIGLQVVLTDSDTQQANNADDDIAVCVANQYQQASATVRGWRTAFGLGRGSGQFPLDPVNGRVMAAFTQGGTMEALGGIDLTAITFSGYAFASTGFQVSPTGSVQMLEAEFGAAGPTITTGAGVPGTTEPKGSMYLRTGGGVGTTLYVSQGAGTWNAVAAV